jgi:protein phosphatase
MRFQTASRTDVGRVRKRNEDSLGFFKPTDSEILEQYGICLAVADGVGGEAHGDAASRTAIATLLKEYYKGPADVSVQLRLKNSVAKANMAVLRASEELRSHGMATTLVTAAVLADRAVVANVGDSRAYVINRPKATIRQVSLDHSLVQEQVRMGVLTPEEAEQAPNKNVITRALGTDPEVKIDVFEVPLVAGDAVLLCSDGLVRVVTDTEIAHIIASNPLTAAVDQLIALANSRGGPDNISVCVAGTVSKITTAILPMAVVAATVVVVGAALLFGGGRLVKTLLLPKPEGQITVQADIKSDPSGATININGEQAGTTPIERTLAVPNSKDGIFQVRLSLDGYTDYNVSIMPEHLQRNDQGIRKLVLDQTLSATKPEDTTVSLGITSNPSGAEVWVNGIDSQKTTPCELRLGFGDHKITIHLAGYDESAKTVFVAKNVCPEAVHIDLKRTASPSNP